MVERDLDVTDDPVVEVGNVERPVGSEFHIDGTEPWIIAHHEVGLFEGKLRSSPVLECVPVDAAGHDVADEYVPSILRRKQVGAVIDDARNRSRAMIVIHQDGGEAEAVGSLRNGIVSVPEQLVNRLGVTIGRINIAKWIEGETEWIHLTVRELLDSGAVEPEAERIA